MIRVGVIGAGPGWAGEHRPALAAVAGRVRAVAVHDAVPLRADQLAAELGAKAVGGLLELARRGDVRAVLLCDPAWWGPAAVDLLLDAGKPVLAAGPADPRDDRWGAVAARAASLGAVVVPDLSMRFRPGTLRLRELVATTLGPVRSVAVVAPLPDPSPLQVAYGQAARADRFVKLADWCAHLLPFPAREVAATADPLTGPATVELRGEPGAAVTADGRGGPGATLTLAPAADLAGDAALVKATVRCESGTATLTGPDLLAAAPDGRPADEEEDLSVERTGFAVLLDLFLRRAVGGLLPAPDLSDLLSAHALARAAAEASAGDPVTLPGAEFKPRPR